jgi:RNA-directed DNA polymerase
MEMRRIAELAEEDPGRKFCSIAHLLTPEALYEAFLSLRRDASAGVDHVTYRDYEEQAWQKVQELYARLKNKTYRALPLRRIYIPKEDGKKRPISIPALEDKIVQKAAVELLSAVYEQDFLDCSYGFRPGRGAHDALDEVGRAICREPTSVVLELDIASYFDSIVREQLIEMIERRISDASVLRLIRKWINVGVIDDGRLLLSETGTGQGQIISPLLANVYLHFVLDRWFERDVKPRLRGKASEIRYADDAVICFQYREDAEKVLQVLPKRFARYGLTLHPEKTRLVEFGRAALARATRAGTKPDTFDFLGLTHKCALSRRGKFTVHVKTMKKRLRRSLKAVAEWCRIHRHDAVDKQQAILNAKLRGHYRYYGRPTNYHSQWQIYRVVQRTWKKWLERRTRDSPSVGRRTSSSCAATRCCVRGSHTFGSERRVIPEEPTAVVPHGGVCGGGRSAAPRRT